MTSTIIILFFLFALLGLSAEIVVRSIKYLAGVLKIKLFAFGILLGIITTLPELSVGINATLDGVAGLSVGNLFGGIVLMLGFILGCSLILNRQVETDGNLKLVIPQIFVIFAPIFLGLDGIFNQIDGLVMIGLYAGLIYYLYRANHSFSGETIALIEKNKIAHALIFSLLGIIAVLVVSHYIVNTTEKILEYWQVSKVLVGILIFSIGTNLPEVSIAITSWRKKTSELSLSHLLSSAFTNILVLGLLAATRPINFNVTTNYYILIIFLGLVLSLFSLFYYSGKKMERIEGVILVISYLLFITATFWVIK